MPKTFVHLTDLHMSNPDVDEPHLYSDTAAILRDALARIDALPDRPEFIIVSGDLTNNEDPVAYQRLRAIWDDVDIPTLFALGNHDSRPDFRREMLGESTDLDAPYDHEAVVAGVHVIVLDSSTPDQIHGTLEDAQLEWLTAALDRHAELPKIVVLHHPPMMGADEPAFECLAPEDTEKLRKVLIGLPLLGLFCGHIHQDRVSIWNGIPVFVGNGHHSRMQPFSDMAIEATDGTGFSVCTLRDSGLTVNFLPQPSEGRTVMAMSHEDAARLMSEPAAEVVG